MSVGSDVAAGIAWVRQRIAEAAERVNRSPDTVTLVAVSKTVPPERVREAVRAGQLVFGENRVQEGVVKVTALGYEANLEWHLIGHLQSNKARLAAATFDVIESVDSLRLAQRLDSLSSHLQRRPTILLEVNVAAEASKSGFSPDQLSLLMPELLQCRNIQIRGLMTVAPQAERSEEVRLVFRTLRRLRDELSAVYSVDLPVLSMGMSADFEVAIEEGATMVRVGRALFGERSPAQVIV